MKLSESSRRAAEDLARILGLLAGVTVTAIDVYVRLCHEPDVLDAGGRATVTAQLRTIAITFRVVDRCRPVLEQMTGGANPMPALAVLRTVGDSMILALSDDAVHRSHRVAADELRELVTAEPVRRFLDPKGG